MTTTPSSRARLARKYQSPLLDLFARDGEPTRRRRYGPHAAYRHRDRHQSGRLLRPEGCTPGDATCGRGHTGALGLSFTNDHPQIAIEVSTPYFLPHSVTIACGTFDGNLYVGARDPETKRWPGWVDDDSEVRLGIGDRVYEVKLDPITDAALIARIRQGTSTKYPDLPLPPDGVPVRYWQVDPRS